MTLAARRLPPLFPLLALSAACSPSDPDAPAEQAANGSSSAGVAGAGDNAFGRPTNAEATSGSAAAAGATGSAGAGTGENVNASAGDGATTSDGGANINAGMDRNTDLQPPDPAELGPVTLYYLDVTQALVMTVSAEGGDPEVVVEPAGRGPDGVAVDASSGHIYWTNMGIPAENDGFILRSDLDGSNVTTIVEEGRTFTPKQLKIELGTGKLYWGDREGMRVQRCNLDGSDLETLVTIAEGTQARDDRSNHAVGIALDTAGGYVYWIQKGSPNGGEGSIRRAALEIPEGETHRNRTDIEVLYDNLPEPIDLDIDVEAGTMYWTDRGDATVNRAPIEIPGGATASTRRDREVLVERVSVAIGIWLDLPLGHVYYSGNDVVGRVDLDGSNNTILVSNAGVLTGITAVRLP